MPYRPNSGPAKRQRTKCFTGCWTCRGRRVKCDERQPVCQRCERFGIACEGYGVRLDWSRCSTDQADQDRDTPVSKPSRRILGDSAPSVSPGLSSTELDGMLERLDSCSTASSRADGAFFSVFSVQTTTIHGSPRPPRESNLSSASPTRGPDPAVSSGRNLLNGAVLPSIPRPLRTPASSSPNLDRLRVEASASTLSSFELVSGREGPGNVRYTNASRTSINEGAQDESSSVAPTERTMQGMAGPGYVDDAPDVERERSSDTLLDERDQFTTAITTPNLHLSSYHLDLLSAPIHQKRLIHHWVTFTSRKLVLLDEPHNPCRTMMLPMALKGLTSASNVGGADIAIFHAICSCAAYNLFELGGRTSEQDQSLALRHEQQAIAHLRHSLAQVDELRDESLAMAIMACIAVEAISGTTRRWRTHITGGLAYLGKLHSRGLIPQISPAFQQHMVSMAIMCGFPVMTDLKTFLADTADLELAFPYYGTSGSFLRAHDRINELSACEIPIEERELELFELQLYLDFPAIPRGGAGSTKAMMVHHVAKAYYYAGLVHFQRVIRQLPVEDVQTLVESGIEELEAIEALGKGTTGSMMLWPALILAADCGSQNLQDRMRSWSRTKRKLGFRNVFVLEDLSTAVWTRRASTKLDVRWQDLNVEERFDVFRL